MIVVGDRCCAGTRARVDNRVARPPFQAPPGVSGDPGSEPGPGLPRLGAQTNGPVSVAAPITRRLTSRRLVPSLADCSSYRPSRLDIGFCDALSPLYLRARKCFVFSLT